VVVVNGERRHSAPGEILVAGAQSALDRGGIKLRIEPDRDAAPSFRCLA
jgi:starch synthase (maltosyl-transferring)